MAGQTPFASNAVEARFAEYPVAIGARLLELRQLILDVASETDGVGPIEETLKWNEPAYLPSKTKSGTTVRINAHRKSADEYALYVNCRTDLLDRYRALYASVLRFEGNRTVIFRRDETVPVDAVRHCIAMALTYHMAQVGRIEASGKI